MIWCWYTWIFLVIQHIRIYLPHEEEWLFDYWYSKLPKELVVFWFCNRFCYFSLYLCDFKSLHELQIKWIAKIETEANMMPLLHTAIFRWCGLKNNITWRWFTALNTRKFKLWSTSVRQQLKRFVLVWLGEWVGWSSYRIKIRIERWFLSQDE